MACAGFIAVLMWLLRGSDIIDKLSKFVAATGDVRITPVAVIYVIVFSVHLLLLGNMVWQSVRYRRPVFRSRASDFKSFQYDLDENFPPPLRRYPSARALHHATTTIWVNLFGQNGFFSESSTKFGVYLVLRKAFTTLVQTVHFCYLTAHSDATGLTTACVVSIALNCATVPLIHRLENRQRAHAHLICLLGDLISTFVGLLMVPVALMRPFATHVTALAADASGTSSLWYRNTEIARIALRAEFQVWKSSADVACVACMAVMHLTSVMALMSIIAREPICGMIEIHPAHVVPGSPTKRPVAKPDPHTLSVLARTVAGQPYAQLPSWMSGLAQVSFMLWGLVLLVCHVMGLVQSQPSGCLVPISRWSITVPGCVVLEYSCGPRMPALGDQLNAMDAKSLRQLIVTGCSHFEIPRQVQRFPFLVGVQIHNSTIANWDLSTELYQHLRFVRLSGTNFTPAATPFGKNVSLPPTLQSVEVCRSNLTVFPSTLLQQDAAIRTLTLDFAQLRDLPVASSLPAHVEELSFVGNNLQTVPTELISLPLLKTLVLDDNPIIALPATLNGEMARVWTLSLAATNISELPPWTTAMVATGARTIIAMNSSLCAANAQPNNTWLQCHGSKPPCTRRYDLD